eukprot:753884-Hanusia_phi.AAC.3
MQVHNIRIRAHFLAKWRQQGAARMKWLQRRVILHFSKGPMLKAFFHWDELISSFAEDNAMHRCSLEFAQFRRLKRSETFEPQTKLEAPPRLDPMFLFELDEEGKRFFPYWNLRVSSDGQAQALVLLLKSIRAAAKFFWLCVDLWAAFARSQALELMVTVVVSLNTISMAMEHSRQSVVGQLWGAGEEGDRRHLAFHLYIQYLNIAFIAVFLWELFVKLVGLGPKLYFSDPMNLFDFFLVVVSSAEIDVILTSVRCMRAASSMVTCEGNGSGLTSLRALRLLRLVRVFRNLRVIQEQIRILVKLVLSIANIFAIYFLFCLMFALLGQALFGATMQEAVQETVNVGMGSKAESTSEEEARHIAMEAVPGDQNDSAAND